MWTRLLSHVGLTLLFILLATSAFAGESYSKATKVSKAHAPGCGKNSFTDLSGECWECPPGYSHDNILLKPTDPKVCKKKGTRTNRKGNKMKSCLVKGGFGPGSDGNCYKCPKGWKHDASKLANKKGACYKKTADKYSAAKRSGTNLFCSSGQFFDPIDKGSCWQCPSDFPIRTLAHAVNSNKACKSETCGGKGARPCTVWERIPSCDKGLAEDFMLNQCVTPDPVAQCMAVVNALNNGLKIPSLDKYMEPMMAEVAKLKKKMSNKKLEETMQNAMDDVMGPYQVYYDEMQRISQLMTKKKDQITREIFNANTLCKSSPQQIAQKLERLGLKPNFPKNTAKEDSNWLPFELIPSAHAATSSPNDEQFYMSYDLNLLSFSANNYTGGFGLSFLTDYKGHGGLFLNTGLGMTSSTPSIGTSIGATFLFDVSEPSREPSMGWTADFNLGSQVSQLLNSKAAISIGMPWDFEMTRPQGFSISVSPGKSESMDLSILSTQSFLLTRWK